jgi:hypothetical protein
LRQARLTTPRHRLGGIRSVKKFAADAPIEDQTTATWARTERDRRAAVAAKKSTGASNKTAGSVTKAAARKASAAKVGEADTPAKPAPIKKAPSRTRAASTATTSRT